MLLVVREAGWGAGAGEERFSGVWHSVMTLALLWKARGCDVTTISLW